jgi:NADH:ubiquinone oxidoreductase subunit K
MIFFSAIVCSHILIAAGVYGLFFRRDNLIITLICLEISLLGVALLFATAGVLLGDIVGLAVFFVLLTLAGVESALGLALVITYYRVRTSIRWGFLTALRG